MTHGSGSELLDGDIVAQWRNTPVPKHTIGNCERWKNCRQFSVDLGNGYCVKCWDKGFGSGGRRGHGFMVDTWDEKRKLDSI